MRYLLFGSVCAFIGAVIGWIARGWITREHFKRDILRSRLGDLSQDQVRNTWEKEL